MKSALDKSGGHQQDFYLINEIRQRPIQEPHRLTTETHNNLIKRSDI